jgi:hypothetical protein
MLAVCHHIHLKFVVDLLRPFHLFIATQSVREPINVLVDKSYCSFCLFGWGKSMNLKYLFRDRYLVNFIIF